MNSFTRRDFLRTATGIAAGTAVGDTRVLFARSIHVVQHAWGIPVLTYPRAAKDPCASSRRPGAT
jgi:hypothetical protein